MNQNENEETTSKQAVWDLDATDATFAEKVRTALRVVEDPELGYNVIELGLIRNVSVTEERMVVTMILTTPFCPYAGQMVEDVRQSAQSVTDAVVFVDLQFDPWDPAMMESGLDFDWGLF